MLLTPGKRLIALVLLLPVLSFAQPSVQEKIVSIPMGSVVEVKLTSKEKLKGQLVTVAPSGITMRVAQGTGTQERVIAFDQIRSVADKSKDRHTGLKILAGVGIAVGALMLIGAIVVAVAGSD
jgi:hypothetical protein